jgi:F0F1-type ATP synthase assembly protein I
MVMGAAFGIVLGPLVGVGPWGIVIGSFIGLIVGAATAKPDSDQ